jgi:homoserine dehydrogenase
MPTVNVGWRDMVGCQIERVEAVLNGTTQGILRAMEQGTSDADALAEMQRRGRPRPTRRSMWKDGMRPTRLSF